MTRPLPLMITNPPQYKKTAQAPSFLMRFAPSFILLFSYALLLDKSRFFEALYYMVHGDAYH